MALAATIAYGQSMSPMRSKVTIFTEPFAARVFPSNPYNKNIRIDVRVYEQDF